MLISAAALVGLVALLGAYEMLLWATRRARLGRELRSYGLGRARPRDQKADRA